MNKQMEQFKNYVIKTVAGQSLDLILHSVQNVSHHHSIINTAKNITETIR